MNGQTRYPSAQKGVVSFNVDVDGREHVQNVSIINNIKYYTAIRLETNIPQNLTQLNEIHANSQIKERGLYCGLD